MKRAIIVFTLAACAVFLALPAAAQVSGNSVGLGFSVGAAFPQGSTPGIPSTDWQPSFNWGFYVNIPLIYTFHITPSSELYRFGLVNATDFDLAFKFIVPLSIFDLYAGVVPGLTAVGQALAPHVGIAAGGSFTLVSNLDAFVQAKYIWLFEGDGSLGVLHLNAGILFTF
jgi:hypothetical protein